MSEVEWAESLRLLADGFAANGLYGTAGGMAQLAADLETLAELARADATARGESRPGGRGVSDPKTKTLVLELDPDDWDAVQQAISTRQGLGGGNVIPPGQSNLAGAVVAEICRAYVEMVDHVREGDDDGEGEV